MKRGFLSAAASCAAAAVCASAALLLASCAQSVEITAPRYALVYGIKAYQYNALQYTVADARSMESLLEARGVSSSNMKEREDAAVTKSQIKADILSLAGIASDSTVILYFSGHGTYVDASWGSDYPTYSGAYIVPYDAVSSTGLTEATLPYLISPSELQDWLAQMGTQNVIVILDDCYSGGFVSTGGAIDASPQDYSSMQSYSAFSTAFANFGDLLSANASASGNKAPIVLSAAGSQEESYDGSAAQGHGVFTYYLLQAATQGDANGDGIVTTTEAYSYTAANIETWGATETAEGYPGGYPFLPHLSGGVRDLVLFGPL